VVEPERLDRRHVLDQAEQVGARGDRRRTRLGLGEAVQLGHQTPAEVVQEVEQRLALTGERLRWGAVDR
jgi:hypothetical protein